MTKKHFIALADAIREHNQTIIYPENLFNTIHLDTLADLCQAQNERFDRTRWLGYIAGHCGPSGGKLK